MFKTANVRLRPQTNEDAPFIEDLFLSTRDSLPGWRDLPPQERTTLLKEQSALQLSHYQNVFPNAWLTIIEVDENPAGRLYVNQTPNEIRIIDISIHPDYRAHGIGSQLLKNVQAESVRTKTPIRLRTELGSSAFHFYKKLGFTETQHDSTHIHFVWDPQNFSYSSNLK